jgi:hypothetical protein
MKTDNFSFLVENVEEERMAISGDVFGDAFKFIDIQ